MSSGVSSLGSTVVLLILCLTCAPRDGRAQDPSQNGPWVPSPRTLARDVADVTTAPFRLSRVEALEVAGVLGATAALVATVDAPVQRHFSSDDAGASVTVPRRMGTLGRAYDRAGTMHVAAGAAAALALGGVARSDRRMTRTSVRVVEAVVLSEVVIGSIKTLTGRMRPFTGEGPHATDPLVLDGNHDALSFPSGHTSQAFALATVLARTYDRWYVQVPAYAVATSQAIQRIESGKHWVSDVVVGAALGHLIGRVVTRTEREAAPNPPGSFDYAPIVSAQRVGLSIRF